jgi:DNA-binding transcriptional ArsR family regulator
MEGHGDGRDSGSSDHIESGGESADEVRFRTLTMVESILRQLVDRHGARTTAGEMLAIYASMARLCKQDRVTIGEIAEATGLSKQNVSRWAQKRIGDSIYLKINEDDQRMHDVAMLDRERGQESIERIAEILGTNLDRT